MFLVVIVLDNYNTIIEICEKRIVWTVMYNVHNSIITVRVYVNVMDNFFISPQQYIRSYFNGMFYIFQFLSVIRFVFITVI